MQPILMNYKQKFKSVQNMSFQNIRHLINSIINGEVSLPDVGYTTAKNYDDEGNLTGETAEAEPTPYQKTANCKKYEAELGWYGLMSPSGKLITPPRYCDITAIGYDLYLCKTDDIRGEVLNGKGVRVR